MNESSKEPRPPRAAAYAPFETLRYDPSALGPTGSAPGFVRLERHLARLERSSAWLGLKFEREAVVSVLHGVVAGLRGAQRVRVSLTPGGEFVATATPLSRDSFDDTPDAALASARAAVAAGAPLPRAALARQSVDETDPARAHKTTARELYYAARTAAERLGLEDVLFLDSHRQLAEGSVSSVFLVPASRQTGGAGKEVFTPPLSSGALPGVLREELIERGLVQERVLSEDDLRSAEAVLLGSSVRGLRRVELTAEPVDVE